MNIQKAALLPELGWEPILDFINRQEVLYYKRLLELPDNRLCKSVFNEMVRKGDGSFWYIHSSFYNDFSCPILPGF
jgi:hypothetical protein